MAITLLGGLAKFPDPSRALSGNISASFFILDASTEKVAIVFPLPKAGTISKLGFRVEAVTTAETLRVSLQTVGADGNPTGTLFGGSAAGTQASPAAGTAYTVTLGTGATVASGDVGTRVAMVIEFDSAVGNVRIAATTPAETPRLPFSTHFTSSAWAKHTSAYICSWVEYSDGSYAESLIYPISATAAHTYASNTAGADEYGCVIRSALSLRAVGWYAYMGLNAGADFEAILYSGTTPQRTDTVDGDAQSGTSVFSQLMLWGLFNSSFTLTADTDYIMAIRPTTTNTLALRYIDFPSAAAMNAYGNANFYQKSRLDQGAWGDSSLRRPMVGILFDAVDIPAGGGAETFTGSQFNRGFN